MSGLVLWELGITDGFVENQNENNSEGIKSWASETAVKR